MLLETSWMEIDFTQLYVPDVSTLLEECDDVQNWACVSLISKAILTKLTGKCYQSHID